MTDILADFIFWPMYFIFIGVIICSLCCVMCNGEWHETRVDSSQKPKCPTNLDVAINGQLEDEENAL